MQITIGEPKEKPKVTGVVSVDPAGHSGLFTGSIVNDPRFLQVFSEHNNLNRLFTDAKRFKHPKNRIRGNEDSGTGVFIVSDEGSFVWATLKGSTTEVLSDLFFLVEEYVSGDLIFMIERPLPQNASTLFTCAYLAGAVCFSYDTEPVFLPPRSFHNANRMFSAFLKRFEIDYKPTQHERDATLQYVHTFYFEDIDVDEFSEGEIDPNRIEEAVIDSLFRFREPSTLSVRIAKERPQELSDLVNWVIEGLSGDLPVRQAKKRFHELVRQDNRHKNFFIEK